MCNESDKHCDKYLLKCIDTKGAFEIFIGANAFPKTHYKQLIELASTWTRDM